MEQKINQLLEGDQTSIQTQQPVTPNYDHIILTDEEIRLWTEWALRIARKKKDAKLNEIAYAARIGKPPVYPTFSYDGLKDFIIKRYNVIDYLDTEKIEQAVSNKNNYYILDDDNTEIFELLCQYFSGDPAFELSGDFSFAKGIMLNGPIGCGKTELMRMFSINSFRPFQVAACRGIASSYQHEGVIALNRYSDLVPVYPQKNLGFDLIGQCFDDLGTEDDKKNFGNQVNVMQEIIYKIYDNRLIGQFHMTTNLGGEEIDNLYGTRIRSRMREMFNQVMFSPDAKDRRK